MLKYLDLHGFFFLIYGCLINITLIFFLIIVILDHVWNIDGWPSLIVIFMGKCYDLGCKSVLRRFQDENILTQLVSHLHKVQYIGSISQRKLHMIDDIIWKISYLKN